MTKEKIETSNWQGETKQTTIRLAKWTILWMLTLTIPAFGPALFWGENHLINSLAILLNVGVGIGMIIANIKHLNTLDELMKKIHLEAMGISLGVAVVGGIAYSMLDVTNIIPFDADISGLIILIALSYLVLVFVNFWRYK
tara:strand:+ start:1242 stop:1664 length:423 start_codon:yes stop_codon:yes gene_type:complete